MRRNEVNKIFNSFTEKASLRAANRVEVQSYKNVGGHFFKVGLSAPVDVPTSELSSVIDEMTNGYGRVVEGSIRRAGDLAVAFVQANTVSKPIDESFSMVTAASAADADGRIWSVVNTDTGKQVVLEAGDDLDGIFKARMGSRQHFANPTMARDIAVASFGSGDAVRYLDVASGKVKSGIAVEVAGVVNVVNPKETVPAVIDSLQVLASVDRRSLPAPFAKAVTAYQARAGFSSQDANVVIDYLRKAYGEASGPMLQHLEDMTKKAAAA